MNSMNHKMLSLMIHAGYEGIDQKQCIFFCNVDPPYFITFRYLFSLNILGEWVACYTQV